MTTALSTLRRRLAAFTRGGNRKAGDACAHPEHQDADQVTLMLLMPREKATALLGEIDGFKANGNIGAVWLNVMHVIGVVTTGALPTGMKPTHVASGKPVGTWWPVNVALLALNLAAAAFFAAMLPHDWLVCMYAAVTSLYVTRSMRWRRHRRPVERGDA